MTRDEALAQLDKLEELARRSPYPKNALAKFKGVVAKLKAVPGASATFRENLTHAETSAAELFIPHEQANSAYTGRTRGVSMTILVLADIAAARRNLPTELQ